MEAYLTVSGSKENFTRVGIVKALREKGVCYGIQYDVIDDVISGNCPRKQILVAKGKDGKKNLYKW